MNNRIAFIDFVRGLLTINPLERWSPQQAKLHPFITQQKYTGPFVPPMNLKSSSLNRSPAPGTQQQQQAEALSKQRAQAAQAQANSAAQGAYAMGQAQYQQQQPPQPQPQQQQQRQQHQPQGLAQPTPPMYPNNSLYSPGGSGHAAPPPPYAPAQNAYGQMVMPQAPAQMAQGNYSAVPLQQSQAPQQQSQSSMYAQQAARSRQRASTMEQQQSGIPAAIQRVASHLDPSQPIRLQPSPAYYPPPADGGSLMDQSTGRLGSGRRGSRAQQQGGRGNNRDFIRNLEERTLEEGFMGGQQGSWH